MNQGRRSTYPARLRRNARRPAAFLFGPMRRNDPADRARPIGGPIRRMRRNDPARPRPAPIGVLFRPHAAERSGPTAPGAHRRPGPAPCGGTIQPTAAAARRRPYPTRMRRPAVPTAAILHFHADLSSDSPRTFSTICSNDSVLKGFQMIRYGFSFPATCATSRGP